MESSRVYGGILTGDMILNELGKGLSISPFNKENLSNNSYDLTLSPRIWKSEQLRVKNSGINVAEWCEIELGHQENYPLEPHCLYIARSVEYVESRMYIPKIAGRSSLARLGLSVCLDANAGDIGYKGHWTLELINHTNVPMYISRGMRICRIEFYQPCGTIKEIRDSRFMYTNTEEL